MRWSGSAWEFVLKIQTGPSDFTYVLITTVSGDTPTPPCGPGFGGTIAGESCGQNCDATVSVSGTTTICAGQSTTLTASGCAGTVSWNNGAGTGPSVNVSPTTTTTYTASCSTAGTCAGSATVTVNSLPEAPVVSVTSGYSNSICTGQNTMLSATNCAGTVTWSPTNATGNSLTVSASGTYTATCTVGSCTSIAGNGITVTVNTAPVIAAPATTNLCSTNPITLNATGTTFQWQRNGIDIEGATGNSYNATLEGTYQVFTTGSGEWTAQTSGTTQTLYGVYFVDAQNGWVVGNGGTILHTVNGGTTWIPQTSGTTQLLYSVWFTSLTNGVAVGQNGTLLRTTDGGTTWGAVAVSTSGPLFKVTFSGSNVGLAVGQGTGQFGSGVILRTTDGGATWTNISTTNSGSQGFRSVTMTDENNSWALWTMISSPVAPARTFKSADGGLTWTSTQNLGGSTGWNDMKMITTSIGYSVGAEGKNAKTTDGGTTWTSMNDGFPIPSGNFLYYTFRAVAFTDVNFGWIVGVVSSSGLVYKTTNGGTTWTAQSLPNGTPALIDAYFTNSTNGWVVGNNGTILNFKNRLCASNTITLTGNPPNLNLTGNATGGTQTASQTIVSTQVVNSGVNATYQAGQSVTLSPNFSASNGSTFLARIQGGCN